jgi:hypothetical protein
MGRLRVAFGLKAHSGWSALVVVGIDDGEVQVIDRRRIELVDAADARSSRQPYHAAESLDAEAARDLVSCGVAAARRAALKEMRAAIERSRQARHLVAACAVLVPEPMPAWSVDEVLAVHLRMHKAEGVLFPDALVQAALACGLNVVTIPEKRLEERAELALATPIGVLTKRIEALKKTVGAPWGKDQKSATLAAVIALHGALWHN